MVLLFMKWDEWSTLTKRSILPMRVEDIKKSQICSFLTKWALYCSLRMEYKVSKNEWNWYYVSNLYSLPLKEETNKEQPNALKHGKIMFVE